MGAACQFLIKRNVVFVMVAVLTVGLWLTVGCPAYAQTGVSERHDAEFRKMNARVVEAYKQGDYKRGIIFAEKAYNYSRKHFGSIHAATLTSMNNLALLYNSQGRYSEAEPLYKNALRISKKILGEDHPNTITF